MGSGEGLFWTWRRWRCRLGGHQWRTGRAWPFGTDWEFCSSCGDTRDAVHPRPPAPLED